MPPLSHLSPTITSRLHQPLRQTHNLLHSTISNTLSLLHLRILHLHIIHRSLLQPLCNLRIHLLSKGKFMLNKPHSKTKTTNVTKANKTAVGAGICEQTILVLFAGSMATTHIFAPIWSEFGNFWLKMPAAKGRRLLKHHPTSHNLCNHLWCCKTPYQPKA